MAVSFLAATKRSATFRRSIDSLVRLTPRPSVSIFLPIDGTAFSASSFVIRPSLPVPVIALVSISFSAKIFLAAGLAVPEAYVGLESIVGEGDSTTGAGVSEATESGLPSGCEAVVSIRQTTEPTATASPSSALSVMVPLTSAGSSSVALSLSTSAMTWSFST